VLFAVGQATKQVGEQILQALFDLSREEIARRVQAGTMGKQVLAAYDYVYDIFPSAAAAR